MNKPLTTVSIGLALGFLANISLATAGTETVTTSKTTTYSGVVSQMNPASSTIIVKSETSELPVTYTYSKETVFVDANGNVVSSETIRNSPVTVEYVTEGGQMIVRRVVQTGPSTVVAPAGVAPSAPVLREKTTTRTETH